MPRYVGTICTVNMKPEDHHGCGPEDYVQAAVSIYLDLLNMFLAILNLLGGRNRN